MFKIQNKVLSTQFKEIIKEIMTESDTKYNHLCNFYVINSLKKRLINNLLVLSLFRVFYKKRTYLLETMGCTRIRCTSLHGMIHVAIYTTILSLVSPWGIQTILLPNEGGRLQFRLEIQMNLLQLISPLPGNYFPVLLRFILNRHIPTSNKGLYFVLFNHMNEPTDLLLLQLDLFFFLYFFFFKRPSTSLKISW